MVFMATAFLAFLAMAPQDVPVVRTGTNPAVIESHDPVWQQALQEIYRSSDELRAQEIRDSRKGLNMPKLGRGSPELKELALTFDDGPHGELTERLLSILKRENVPATFFVIGKMVKKFPDVTREIVRDGHILGNHTFSHVTLTKIPTPLIETEFKACNDIVYRTTGVSMRFCRPPGGDYNADVINAATRLGLTTVLWTDDPGDFARPNPAVLEDRTLERLSSGGIILLHDGVEETMQVLPRIISFAKSRGFRFVTIRQLAAHRALYLAQK